MKAVTRYIIVLALLPLASACTQIPPAPLATVDAVEINRYTGDWYEIAMLPNRFQAQCVADTQANYQLDGQDIRVRNRCRMANGKIETANGIAKIVGGSGNAKLRVSFFRPFYGDYWILALDTDYQWVLIGEPGRKYGWILSRTQTMNEATLASLLNTAAELGFDRAAFRRTTQSSAKR